MSTLSPTGYQQTEAFPGGPREIRITIGVLPEDDHVQVQVEMLNPSGGELLALQSRWHAPLRETINAHLWAHGIATSWLLEALNPFDIA